MKVTYKEEPNLFKNIEEFSVDLDRDHRKGSSFYETHIIELKIEDSKYFPKVKDFEKYLGFWKTNTVLYNDDWGYDEEFSELTKVKQVVKTVKTITYE